METLRKIRHPTWASRHRNRSISPGSLNQSSLNPPYQPGNQEVQNAGARVYIERSSDDVPRSGCSSPGASTFSEETLAPRKTQSKYENPLGLNVIYEPEVEPTVDIIFVHGLNGTSRSTWSKDKNTDHCWPEKWLPQEPEICTARVLSFGYNAAASPTRSATMLNITDFGKNLLFCMKYGKDERKDELDVGKVPIIFVVHSMGGLVAKKAYLLGQSDAEYQHIAKAVSSIIFLATPHRGSNLAELLDSILQVTFHPKQYVTDLKSHSPMLESLNEEFRHVAPELQIFSFYETIETQVNGLPLKKMVLNKDSSILGYKGEVSTPMHADHHDVCKFYDQEDPNYVNIRNVLKTLVGRFRHAKSNITNDHLPEDLKKVQNLLAVTETPEDDLKFFHDRWMTGTCDWIKYEDSFKNWVKHGSTSKILWLYGPPASGKSVLSSFIIEYLNSLDISCSFFFFRFGDQTKRSPNALLRSLAYQMASQLPTFRRKLRDLHDDGLRFEKTDARTIWKKVFVGALFKTELQDPLYWVVDALDECDSSHTALDILSSIPRAGASIHLLLIGRFTEPLSSSFERLDNVEVFQSQAIGAHESDIYTFVRKELHYLKVKEAFKRKILKGIQQRASGNFLWVTLAMKEISKCYTEDAIEQALNDIPTGMGPLYERMETNIARDLRDGDKDLAKHILTWAACSRRAMSLAELSQALESDFPNVLDLGRTIGEVCGQFVVVDSTSQVAMIHQTARKYLLKTSKLEFSINAHTAHRRLLTRSLSFLLDPALRAKLERIAALPASPFLQYAATCWPYHLRHVPTSKEATSSLLPLLVKFFNGPYVLTWIHALGYYDQLSVLVQASRDLTTFVSHKRRLYADDVPFQQPIEDFEVLELWAADLLKLFAKFGPNLRQKPGAIHKLIPPFCPKSSALYLQFGRKEKTGFSVKGLTNPSWDDCLAKISLGTGLQALQMECIGHHFWVLMTSGVIILYDAISLREIRRVRHDEYVFSIGCKGDTMVSYGYYTTKLWSTPEGQQKHMIDNPKDCKALNAFAFIDNDMTILLGCDDKTIRKLDLTRPKQGWQILDEKLLKAESPIKGTNTNTPRYIDFSPDASQVAVAYRGYPLSIWSLPDRRSIATLRREHGSRKHISNTWTGVDRVRWHPNGGEILGLYNDGCVFKWNVYEEDTQEVRARASEIDISNDGVLFATSDIGGVIKIWNYHHFAMVYQLSCDNGITDICFSPDCRRIYDLNGSQCNVWEPNVLIRLTETEERASERESEAGSASQAASGSEASAETADPVTALDASTTANLFCAGNDAGVIQICDLKGNRTEIYRSPRFLTIDLVHFSQDGHLVAYSELGGQVGIFQIHRTGSAPLEVTAKPIREIKTMDGVHQLLFSPDSKCLLIDGASTCRLWDLASGSSVREFGGSKHRAGRMLINNPKDENQFFDFCVNSATVHAWDGHKILRTLQFSNALPMLSVSDSLDRAQLLRRRSSPVGIGRMEITSSVESIFHNDPEHIVLHTTQTSAGALTDSKVSIIETSSISPEELATPDSALTIPLPASIQSNIRKPVGLLERRLIYLDHDSWVCTWSIDSRNDSAGLQRHFFIPRDWLNAETLERCQLMSNGAFLFPHYGEVAVIESALSLE